MSCSRTSPTSSSTGAPSSTSSRMRKGPSMASSTSKTGSRSNWSPPQVRTRSRADELAGLGFAVPVIELGRTADQVIECLVVAPPDTDLVAVGILDDAELVPVREQGHANGLLTCVA